MGAINYGHNEVINIGYDLKTYDTDNEDNCLWCEDCYEQVKWALERNHFEFFKVELNGGYYEGFYLDISFKFLWLENSYEKQQALKETTKLGNFLRECINNYCMVVYNPGWCTSYEDKETSLKMVKNAIKKQKDLILCLETERTLTLDKWKQLVGIGDSK